MDYTPHNVDELLQGDFTDEPVVVSGIPRGSTLRDEDIFGYLQEGFNFVPFYGKTRSSQEPALSLSLLHAASESGLEVRIQGLYSTHSDEGNSGYICLHHVDLQNVGMDFNP